MLIAGCFLGFLENILATIEETWTDPTCCGYRLFGELFWIIHTSENKTMSPYLCISFVMNSKTKRLKRLLKLFMDPSQFQNPSHSLQLLLLLLLLLLLFYVFIYYCVLKYLLYSLIYSIYISLLHLKSWLYTCFVVSGVGNTFPFCN